MTRDRVFFACFLLLAACGGEQSAPLRASFPMGAADVRRAISETYPTTLAPEDAFWPADAPVVDADLRLVREALVDVGARGQEFTGTLKVRPALLSVREDDSPIEAVELILAPDDAVTPEPDGVVVAHGDVPRTQTVSHELAWTEDGPRVLSEALRGTVAGRTGQTRFVLFLRGSAPHIRGMRNRLHMVGVDAGPDAA